jgi:hypothetical protein
MMTNQPLYTVRVSRFYFDRAGCLVTSDRLRAPVMTLAEAQGVVLKLNVGHPCFHGAMAEPTVYTASSLPSLSR